MQFFLMLSIESTNSSVGKNIAQFIVSANLFANFDSTIRLDKSKEKGTGSFLYHQDVFPLSTLNLVLMVAASSNFEEATTHVYPKPIHYQC